MGHKPRKDGTGGNTPSTTTGGGSGGGTRKTTTSTVNNTGSTTNTTTQTHNNNHSTSTTNTTSSSKTRSNTTHNNPAGSGGGTNQTTTSTSNRNHSHTTTTTSHSSRRDKRSDSFSHKKLEKLFEKYLITGENQDVEGDVEVDGDMMNFDGIVNFLTDIGIDPEDPVTLVICYHLNAQQFGAFSKEEFVNGFEKLNCDSIEKIQNTIPELRDELDDPSLLKEIYKYSFDFSKESEQKKGIEKEVAITLLRILLNGKPHVENFISFLNAQESYKVINSDQWSLFLEFSSQVSGDFSDYDPNGPWPVIIDEYVEWSKNK